MIPIVSLTAFCDETTIKAIYNSGADKVVNKPLNKREIEKILSDYLY